MFEVCGFSGKADKSILKKMLSASAQKKSIKEELFISSNLSVSARSFNRINPKTVRQFLHEDRENNIRSIVDGEIYNFSELQADLEKKGHKFSVKSNSELVAQLYLEYGTEFIAKIDGSFMIVLWDEKQKRLLLGRDRVGAKNLYYFIKKGNIFFGSELKMILSCPAYKKEIDFEALHNFFSFGNVPQPKSIFRNISYLMPGELLVFKNGSVKKKIFWQLKFRENRESDERAQTRRAFELLSDSINRRMPGDSQFGALLSGGIDSSVVVAILSMISQKPIRTFHLNYGKKFSNKWKDVLAARKVAKLYKTAHQEYQMGSGDVKRDMEQAAEVFDEPLGVFVPFSFFAKIAQNGIEKIFSGDGGDEVFGGYGYYQFVNSKLSTEKLWRWRAGRTHFSEIQKRNIYSDFLKKKTKNFDSVDVWKKYFKAATAESCLGKVMEVDIKNIFPEQSLYISRNATNVSSIQIEAPFLDYKLMEFAASLRNELKLKNGRGKYIIKKGMRGLLPSEILDRPKEVFMLAEEQCLSGGMEKYVRKVLSRKRLVKHGFFNIEKVGELVDSFYSREIKKEKYGLPKKSHLASKIFRLVMFQLWWEKKFNR